MCENYSFDTVKKAYFALESKEECVARARSTYSASLNNINDLVNDIYNRLRLDNFVNLLHSCSNLEPRKSRAWFEAFLSLLQYYDIERLGQTSTPVIKHAALYSNDRNYALRSAFNLHESSDMYFKKLVEVIQLIETEFKTTYKDYPKLSDLHNICILILFVGNALTHENRQSFKPNTFRTYDGSIDEKSIALILLALRRAQATN